MDDFTAEHLPTDRTPDPLSAARGILNAALIVIGVALIARAAAALLFG